MGKSTRFNRPVTISGLNVRQEFARVFRHARAINREPVRREGYWRPWRKDFRPRLSIAISPTINRGVSGRCWFHRIHLTIGENAPAHRIQAVIAHEIAHCLAWHTHHGPAFWDAFRQLVDRAFPGAAYDISRGDGQAKDRAIAGGIANLTRR